LNTLSFRILILFSFFTYVSSNCLAQNKLIDSLKGAIKKARNDSSKINTLNALSDGLWRVGKYDTAIICANDAKTLAETINYKNGISGALKNIGIIYECQGNYPEAIKYDISALNINQETGNKQGIASNLNEIGIIYSEQEIFPNALQYEIKALSMMEEVGDRANIAAVEGNIGVIYCHLKDFSRAIEYLLKALAINKEIRQNQGIASNLNGIGNAYLYQLKYSEALDYLLKSLLLYQELGDKHNIESNLTGISSCYLGLYQYPQAIKYAQDGLDIAKQIGDQEGIELSYQDLAAVYVSMNNYKLAYHYYQLYSQNKDSVFNDRKSQQIIEMQTKYETAKKEKEIESQQLQIKQKNFLVYETVIGTAFVLIVTFLLAWLFFTRNKHKTTELQQKLLRSQMNPHFLFNSLFSIQGFMLEKNGSEAVSYLAKFAELMRQILDNSREEYVSLEREIKTLENYLELQKLRFENRFNYKIILDDRIDVEFISVPPMLAQPFIENAIEHGLRSKANDGLIIISFSLKNSNILFEITDNGIGINEAERLRAKNNLNLPEKSTVNKPAHKSLATKITMERLSLLNKWKRKKVKFGIEDIGSMNNGLHTGTKVSFTIPIKNT
jgi:tetratricopeptide (TPR) repeat protein